MIDNKNIKMNTAPTPLHYILRLGNDYIHQSINCNSAEDMQNKAKLLEEKFGPMEIVIRIKKNQLVISGVITSKSSSKSIFSDFNRNIFSEDAETGILFNPPLAKQLNLCRNNLEKLITIDDILEDNSEIQKESTEPVNVNE